MNALKHSPRVTTEQLSSRTPAFSSPRTKPLSKLSSPKKSILSPKLGHRQLDIAKAPLNKYLKPSGFNPEPCKCSHVIVADDDSFQHLYYQNLFQRYMDLGQLDMKPSEFKLELCLSGEDLLEKFGKVKTCGCKKIKMIITDYYMGEKKLNGYETAIKMRDLGYSGPLLLRTSEEKADLAASHPDMERFVTCVIEKGNVKAGKELIIKYLKQKDEVM